MKLGNTFKKGLKDGVPIGLGYLGVAIGVGIAAISAGLTPLTGVLISMTNLTSAGEAAGISLIAAGGTLLEMALVQLVINLRYSLMAITLTQKLDSSFTFGQRLLTATFITDEIFAVSASHNKINTRYLYGLAFVPYIGWAVGTAIGAYGGSVLPADITAALGLALYGMFVAIITPAMRKSLGITLAVILAALFSTIMQIVPFFSFISYGFSVIIAAISGAAVAAFVALKYSRYKATQNLDKN